MMDLRIKGEIEMINLLDAESKIQNKNRIDDFKKIILVFLCGVLLGIFSKYLDVISRETLPLFLNSLELDRFLSRIPIWLSLATFISISFKTPLNASISVFLFFFGLVSSYYWYSSAFLGIYPAHQVSFWFKLTLISPVLAYICWYLQKNKWYGFLIYLGIVIVLFYFSLIEPIILDRGFSMIA